MSDRPTLDDASGPAAILEALARAVWAKEHDGEDPPAHRIPSAEALAEWLPTCHQADRSEANALTATLLGAPSTWRVKREREQDTVAAVVEDETPTDGRRLVVMEDPEGRVRLVWLASIEAVHAAWRVAAPRRRHPLAPLVDAWQRLVQWTADEHPVLAGTLAGRDGGLRPLFVANDRRQLPLALTGGSGEPPRQLGLDFGHPEPDRVPVLPLVAFDARGGVSMTSGAGAAHAIRLYVEALLEMPQEMRRGGYGAPVSLHARLRDVVAGLWPRGWQRGRDWPRLLSGFDELRRLGVEWEHNGEGGVWFAVTVRNVPRDAKLDDLVIFEVLLPPGSGPGPMVARDHLRLLGLDSAPAYRLYLSLCWYWDHHGTAAGRLIGTAPPQRRKGKPVPPVMVGDTPINPAALHRYPPLTPDHLAQMAYAPADLRAEGTSTRRRQRQLARAALDRIAEQTGAVVIPAPGPVTGTVQVLPPASHKAAHDAKADLWRHVTRG